MALSTQQVHAKAKAFVDALCKLPRSQYAAVPRGHFGRDYNTLRKLALEALPGLDDRLLGKYVTVHALDGTGEACDATYVEIETYARQILEQLNVAAKQPAHLAGMPVELAAHTEKTYDVAEIRREHSQAYRPWSAQDDAYLRSRFLEGASIEDLVSEFARQAGGIVSRLRKLGLERPGSAAADEH
jgi:hypothetical protein